VSELTAQAYAVGWVKDAHSLKGELYIQLFAKQADWLSSFKIFWLKPKSADFSAIVQFEVAKAKAHKDGLIVKSNAIIDRTAAEKLKGFTFLIPESYLEAKPSEGIFLLQIKGFKVFDLDRELGFVSGFSTNNMQDLLIVNNGSREILIPYVDAFIKRVDFDNQRILMELPPGLEDDI
jgi:16S rRNA processing protein RimM